MPEPELLVSIAFAWATAGLLAYVGLLTWRRPAEGEARAVLRWFATWWFGAAAVLVMSNLHTAVYVVGLRDPALHLTITYATAVPLALCLWGLLAYLLYIYTGRLGVVWVAAVVYGVFLVYTYWFYGTAGPREVEVTRWAVRFSPREGATTFLSLLFGGLLAVPILLVTVAYGTLALRLKEKDQRYRALVVSGALLLLFASVLLGFLLRWGELDWYVLTYQLPALAAAGLILAAYRPPRWVQGWLGVHPLPTGEARPL